MHGPLRPIGYHLKTCIPRGIRVSRISIWCRGPGIDLPTPRNKCLVTPGSTALPRHTPLPRACQPSATNVPLVVCGGYTYFLQNPSFGQKLVTPKSHPSGSPYRAENVHSLCARTRAHERWLLIEQIPTHALEIASPACGPKSVNPGAENRSPTSTAALPSRGELPLLLGARFRPGFAAALTEIPFS